MHVFNVFFIKVKKHVFYVFYLQSNVFNVYATDCNEFGCTSLRLYRQGDGRLYTLIITVFNLF